VGAEYVVRSCGERVFVDGAAEPVVSADPKVVEVGDECRERCERRGLVKGALRPMLVVVSLVFAQACPGSDRPALPSTFLPPPMFVS
jgi:hypothetical protein